MEEWESSWALIHTKRVVPKLTVTKIIALLVFNLLAGSGKQCQMGCLGDGLTASYFGMLGRLSSSMLLEVSFMLPLSILELQMLVHF
jgi:hypothetical protein